TVYTWVFNGLFLGLAFGLFANFNTTAYLLTFVAGHGVLELTPIFIPGRVGLRLARALITAWFRLLADALFVAGAIAVWLFGYVEFTTTCFTRTRSTSPPHTPVSRRFTTASAMMVIVSRPTPLTSPEPLTRAVSESVDSHRNPAPPSGVPFTSALAVSCVVP